jgi:hypothetical protein
MTAVATRERPRSGSAEPPTQRLFEPQGPTLEDAILAVWNQLASTGRATCPVCSGELSRRSGCEECGAEFD